MARLEEKKMPAEKPGGQLSAGKRQGTVFSRDFSARALTFFPGASIIMLFQVEAARFSPMRILFCTGMALFAACNWRVVSSANFFIGLKNWEVHRHSR